MAVRKRRSDRSGRGALPSPGRPSVARREHHRQFWAAIAAGRSSEDAAVGAGVSPAVGARWFRRAGGMPPSHLAPSAKPLSGRSLSFAEREEIAIGRAQRHGVRAIARRLKRAHYNLVENVPLFVVAVMAGELRDIHTGVTAACAMVFFWARVAHPVAAISHIWGTRTTAFAVGWAAVVIHLFVVLTP